MRTSKLWYVFRCFVFCPQLSFFLGLICSGQLLWANSGITYHGRILQPDGVTPVNSPTTQFRIQIRTPGNENCLLWEEQQTRDLSATRGVFSLTIADTSDPSLLANTLPFSLDRVFSNRTAFSALTNCSIGSVYNPTPSDGRTLQVFFRENPADIWEPMPLTKVNFVPLTLNSLQLEGYRSSEFLQLQPSVTQSALSQAQVNTLMQVLTGGAGSPYIAKADGFSGDVTGTYGVTAVERIRGVNVLATAPTTGQVLKFNGAAWAPAADDSSGATDATYAAKGVVQVDTSLGTSGLNLMAGVLSMPNVISAAGPVGNAQTIPVVTYDSKGRLTTVTTATVNDTTKLSLGGGTLTGPVNMGNQQLTNAASVSATSVSTRSVVFNDNDVNIATLQAPANLPANYTLTLPVAAPQNGYLLSTDATGNLSWIAPSSGSVTSVTSTNNYLTVGGTPAAPTLTVNVGTVADTVAAGNDARIVNAVQQSAYSADLAPAATCAGNQKPSWNTVSDAWECLAITGFVTSTTGIVQNGNTFGADANIGTNDNFALNFETAGTTKMTVLANGNVGIGTTTPNSPLSIVHTNVSAGGYKNGVGVSVTLNPSSSAFARDNGISSYIETSGTNSFTGSIRGIAGFADNSTNNNINEISGGYFDVYSSGGGTITNLNGASISNWRQSGTTTNQNGLKVANFQGSTIATNLVGIDINTQRQNSGTVANIYGIRNYVDSGGTVTNMYGQHTRMTNWGSATNVYAHYIDNIGFGTNTYGIYQAGSSDKNYFAGNVGIGTTTPATKLDVAGAVRIGNDATACAAGLAGSLRYNASVVEFCNGSTWQALGVSGAGLTALNGQSGNTQTFASGSAGTAPAFSSISNVHTLNIPLASGAGVTSGTISKTDFDSFNNKIAPTSGTSGGIPYFDSSSTMASSSALIANGVVLGGGAGTAPATTAAGTANQVLRVPAGGGAPAFGAIDLVAAVSGVLPIANGGTNSSTALTNDKVMVSSGGAIIEGSASNTAKSNNTFVMRDGSGNIAAALGTFDQLAVNGAVSGAVNIYAPSTLTSWNMTLPLNDGDPGQLLATNGSGVTSWVTGLTSTTGFIQDGNTFGATATLGTNDNFALNFETNGTTKMTVLANGNVGVGTASPLYKLQVRNDSGSGNSLMLTNNDFVLGTTGSGLYFQGLTSSGNTGYVIQSMNSGGVSTGNILLNTSGGNVGVGTTSPLELVHLSKSQNLGTMLSVENTNTGIGSSAGVSFKNSLGTIGDLSAYSSGYAIAPKQNRLVLRSTNASTGVNIEAMSASGDIRFETGGSYERIRIDSSGNVGIGTTTPGSALEINKIDTSSTAFGIGTKAYYQTNSTSGTSGATRIALQGYNQISNSAPTSIGTATGVQGYMDNRAGVPVSSMTGVEANADKSGTSTVGDLQGIASNASMNGSGTVTNLRGAYLYPGAYSGTVTNQIGAEIRMYSDGTVTNRYGILLTAPETYGVVTNDFGIYQQGPQNNYFAGNVGIGTTTPGSSLDIAGATTQRGIAAPAVSAANQGRIYFDSTSNKFRVSENGGAYVDLVGGGGGSSLPAAGGTAGAPGYAFTGDPDTGLFSAAADSLGLATNGTARMEIDSSGRVGIGRAPVANTRVAVQGAVAGSTNIIASGATVDLALSNTHVLRLPGTPTITLQNMVDGGTYTIFVTDTTPRTYNFSGCTSTYFSPANGETLFRSSYTIAVVVDGGTTECFVSWNTGFN